MQGFRKRMSGGVTYYHIVWRDGLRDVVPEAVPIPCEVEDGYERIAIDWAEGYTVEASEDVGTCRDPNRRVQAVSSEGAGIACRLSRSNAQETQESEHEEGTHL